MKVRWLVVLLLVLCCGCAAPSSDPPGNAEPSRLSRTLSRHFWGHSDGVFRGRYSAVMEQGAQVFSFQGILVGSTQQRQVRLVALSDLGMRLFDMTVATTGVTVHSALPHPGLSRIRKRVATALCRMLLSHLPGSRDAVAEHDGMTLRRCLDGQCLMSRFDARSGLLLYKEYGREALFWHAAFSDYRDCGGIRVPMRLIYADNDHDFTLTMAWTPGKVEP